MHKLSATDASFLYNETETCPMSVASVQIFELPTDMNEADFIAGLKVFLGKRLHMVPYLTNKLQMTAFDQDHPVWVFDANVDLDKHVYRVDIAAPGDRAAMESAVAQLHAQALDRSRPLWDMAVLCGLEGGRIAYYSRVHHACIDGMAGQAATQVLMDEIPDRTDIPEADAQFYQKRREYNGAELMIAALENFAKYQLQQISGLADNLDAMSRLVTRAIDPSKGFGAAAERAPRTSLNRPVYKSRSFATGEMGLKEVKRIGKACGGTINDVFVAVCGAALGRYFEQKGELLKDHLIAGCPVSLRRPGDTSLNNQVTMMQVSMGSGIHDPIARIQHVAASAATAKGLTADLAGLMPADVSFPGLPSMTMAGARSGEMLGASAFTDSPINVVISNVPGPRETLYSNGAQMLTHYPVSIPAHGTGVNITVQSYRDQLYFGITACATALPDAAQLRDLMLQEIAILTAATQATVEQIRPAPLRLEREKQAVSDASDMPFKEVA